MEKVFKDVVIVVYLDLVKGEEVCECGNVFFKD